MKRYWNIILAVCMMWMPVMVSAQEKQNQRQVYEKAEEAYHIGQLDQAIEFFPAICVKAHFDWFLSVILRKMTKKLLRNMLVCC